MTEQNAGPNGHVYIVSAARTPIGKFGGALATAVERV
jgi:acetyl-CoA acetyltransferase